MIFKYAKLYTKKIISKLTFLRSKLKFLRYKKIRVQYLKDIKLTQNLKIDQFHIKNITTTQNHLSPFFKKQLCENDPNTDLGFKIIKNILYIPSSELALKRNLLYLSESIELDQGELTPELLFSYSEDLYFKVSKNLKSAKISKNYYNVTSKTKNGINLLHSINNYWHFLIEQAPKIIISQHLKIPATIPLLVPDNLHPNLYNIINVLNQGKFKREILKIRSDIHSPLSVEVKKSYHISDHLNIQTHYRENQILNPDLYPKQQLKINPLPIKETVRKIFDHYKLTPKPNKNIKLFLKRESNYRISKDQEKLESLLLKNGFTIFNPTKLSFEEQVRICSEASVFIGFSGAGFTNSVFLPESSKKILFANKTFIHLVSLWNVLLNNIHVLDNGFKETTYDKVHGEPYLTRKNWEDLERILKQVE